MSTLHLRQAWRYWRICPGERPFHAALAGWPLNCLKIPVKAAKNRPYSGECHARAHLQTGPKRHAVGKGPH
jgi:hypothetical protein